MKNYMLIVCLLSLSSCVTGGALKRQVASNKSPLSVLHVGDSHTKEFFGEMMFDFYAANFQDPEVCGVHGSSPHHWKEAGNTKICGPHKNGRINEKSPVSLHSTVCDESQRQSPFEKLLERVNPDVLVLQFLGNSRSRTVDELIEDVEALKMHMSDIEKCVFVFSPFHYMSHESENEKRVLNASIIEDSMGDKCEYINIMKDSDMHTRREFYKDDLMHMTEEGALHFSDYVKEKLSSILDL